MRHFIPYTLTRTITTTNTNTNMGYRQEVDFATKTREKMSGKHSLGVPFKLNIPIISLSFFISTASPVVTGWGGKGIKKNKEASRKL